MRPIVPMVLAAISSGVLAPACGQPQAASTSRAMASDCVRSGSRALRGWAELGWRQQCQRQITEAESNPGALDGAGPQGRARAQLLARAEGEPVVFVRTPRPATPLSRKAEAIRRRLGSDPSPGNTLFEIYRKLLKSPSLAREVLLTEGYLYTESPALAAVLVRTVRLEHLFSAPELVIERGSRRLTALRVGDHYQNPDGETENQRATLLLFDRVWVAGEDPGPPLHRSLREVRSELGFDTLQVRTMHPERIVAELSYGEQRTLALLRSRGPLAELSCELVPRGQREGLDEARRRARRRARVVAGLQRTILAQIAEALPFDEPRTEDGQQDGKLRIEWRKAYERGRSSFEFNEDRYYVFDRAGRPRVPQVCIDFIIDTLERASGTWWQPRGEPRLRSTGRFDFRAFEVENRRSVESFLEFAEGHPEWFEVLRVPDEDRIPFLWRRRFFERLYDERRGFGPGDIVAIYGLRDDGLMHYHSFFVLEDDPVTGMPIRVASNAGRPRVRSWESEMLSAPLRGVRARVRPKLSWYETIVVDEAPKVSQNSPRESSSAI